jgi:predicted transcriptional regulator
MLDDCSSVSYAEVMEVHFAPELQARLDRIAEDTKGDVADYVRQLVEHYIDHDIWLRRKVENGLGQLDRGEHLTHEEVGVQLKKMFRP